MKSAMLKEKKKKTYSARPTFLDQSEDHIVLFLRLQRDQVHAEFATQISAVQPVELLVLQFENVAREEVILSVERELFGSCEHWEGETKY